VQVGELIPAPLQWWDAPRPRNSTSQRTHWCLQKLRRAGGLAMHMSRNPASSRSTGKPYADLGMAHADASRRDDRTSPTFTGRSRNSL